MARDWRLSKRDNWSVSIGLQDGPDVVVQPRIRVYTNPDAAPVYYASQSSDSDDSDSERESVFSFRHTECIGSQLEPWYIESCIADTETQVVLECDLDFQVPSKRHVLNVCVQYRESDTFLYSFKYPYALKTNPNDRLRYAYVHDQQFDNLVSSLAFSDNDSRIVRFSLSGSPRELASRIVKRQHQRRRPRT